MTGELKRTMKLMWGHSEKFRFVCGCSLLLILIFSVLAFGMEALFWGWRDFPHRGERVSSSYLGTASCMYFLFLSAYGNGKGILNGMGKWLCGSKLAKSVLVKGVMINRLIIFGLLFVPCLISRICLICQGYTDHARIELFLILWGITYLASAVSNVSEVTFIVIFAVYMISMFWNKFWTFATWIRMPVWGAIVLFLVCLIGGTLLEKVVLERNYKNRTARKVSLMHTGTEGRRVHGE